MLEIPILPYAMTVQAVPGPNVLVFGGWVFLKNSRSLATMWGLWQDCVEDHED